MTFCTLTLIVSFLYKTFYILYTLYILDLTILSKNLGVVLIEIRKSAFPENGIYGFIACFSMISNKADGHKIFQEYHWEYI